MAIRLIPFITREDSDTVIGTTTGTNNPIYSSFVFAAATINDIDAVESDESDKLPELDLQTVLIAYSKTKNIVSTQVQGRKGVVNEYISDGDYRISISGSLNSDQLTVAPYELLTLLDRFAALGQSLEVAGAFLEAIGVETVVILDIDASEVRGTRNQIDFRMVMRSEIPIELEVNNNTTEEI